MTTIFDSGALIALERGDRATWRRLKRAAAAEHPVVTHGGVVAQVWRTGDGRQVRLALAMSSIDVKPLDADLGRRAGALLGRAGTSDAIDAAVAVLANTDDIIVTSDVDDLKHLVDTLGRYVDIVAV